MSFSELLNRKSYMHMGHFRQCPECRGVGWTGKLAGGSTKYRLMAKVQCNTCKGKGEILAGEEVREGGKHRVFLYGPDGKPLDNYEV